jgi:hypothetical protein
LEEPVLPSAPLRFDLHQRSGDARRLEEDFWSSEGTLASEMR